MPVMWSVCPCEMTTALMSSRLIPASERLFASNPPLGPNIFDTPSPVSNRTILPLLLTTNELSSIFISDGFMKLSVSSLRTSSFGTPRNEFDGSPSICQPSETTVISASPTLMRYQFGCLHVELSGYCQSGCADGPETESDTGACP